MKKKTPLSKTIKRDTLHRIIINVFVISIFILINNYCPMYSFQVLCQTTFIRTWEIAELTGKWFLACMRPDVSFDHGSLISPVVALVAHEFVLK